MSVMTVIVQDVWLNSMNSFFSCFQMKGFFSWISSLENTSWNIPKKKKISLKPVKVVICFSVYKSQSAPFWLYQVENPSGFCRANGNKHMSPITAWKTPERSPQSSARTGEMVQCDGLVWAGRGWWVSHSSRSWGRLQLCSGLHVEKIWY